MKKEMIEIKLGPESLKKLNTVTVKTYDPFGIDQPQPIPQPDLPIEGKLQDRYDIYLANVTISPGQYVKTFDEWLNS